MSRIALRACASALLALSLSCISPQRAFAQEAASCAPAVGRLVSVQGNVDVQRAGTQDWMRIKRLDTSVCTGDRVRTAPLSRAALFVQPETLLRVDQNTTIALSQTTAEIVVEFFQDDVIREARDAQSCGAGYFITRFPKRFKVSTPHLNAAVEGTEFQVALSCDSTELVVLEGEVLSSAVAAGQEQVVTAGQALGAGASPGLLTTISKPADAVQWVLYYPQLSDSTSEGGIATPEQCRSMASPSDQDCLIRRAEALMRLGLSEEALQDVQQALALNPRNGDANALLAIIQIARNDQAAALQSAQAATSAAPESSRAWLALSYAQQAAFELERSLESARKAQALEPGSSLLHARVAELLLSLGRTREAETAARAAVQSNPDESRAHTILGFVHLAQIDTTAARDDFNTAIEHDSFNPLPRLGLGLAIIRDGKLTEGREQIEIAVALDPTNSLLRSYVGKAYYEENTKERDQLATAQFDLARQLDVNDPTPWFYEAILRQAQNQPVEALEYLHTSVEKNDNRAVYRSKLGLDQDIAARTASVASIYGNLGFEKLAILESTKAIEEDAGDYSAHRLLATVYANVPRYDIARVSEALQAQIRQPVSVSPVPPLLTTDNLAIIRDTGPSQVGINEYNALFNQDGARLDLDGISASRDTLGDQFVVSALADDVSVAVSQLHYETDGFIENDAAEKDIYDLFIQKQIAWNSSIQLDLKRSDFEIEEFFFRFDPDFSFPATFSEEAKFYRLSGHHGTDVGGDWIWSAVYEDRFRVAEFEGEPFTDTDVEAYSGEIQHSRRWGEIETISGVGYVEDERDFQIEQVLVRSTAGNAYLYGQWRSPDDNLRLHAGLAAEWYRRRHSDRPNSITRERLSPKLGLTWSPRAGSTIRLAAFSSVRRPFVASQTIEPTQLAGFNQFFSGVERLYGDVEGTISRRAGIAFDQALSRTLFAGAEVAKRKLDVPSINLAEDFTWRESTGTAYLYKTFSPFAAQGWLARWRAVAALEGEYEELERPQVLTGSEGIMELRTTRVPIGLRLLSDRGLSLRVQTTYVRQSGTFSLDVDFSTFDNEDDAWITDVALEYRLPRRLGVVSLGVMNIGDDFIDLLEVDPLNPRVATRRFAFVKVRITL
jgi:tetratricopeptide (TPR) repeat protein